MTTQKHGLLKTIVVLAASAATWTAANAQGQVEIVYNNTTTSLQASYESALEFGDQVTLQGLNRSLSRFQFEYSASLTPSANKIGVVRMYANDGPAGAPGTLIWETDPFTLENGQGSVSFDGVTGVTLPNTLTWSLVASGLSGGERFGVQLYDPPTVGSSGNEFWQKNAFGGWSSQVLNNANGSTIANFSARITAVPEPTTIAFAVVGGLALLGVSRRKNS